MAELDEQRFIARLEAAQPDELARIVTGATAVEERLLRDYLGDLRYRRLRGLALRRQVRAGARPLGNVVVIHGIMGGELTSVDSKRQDELVWMNIVQLAMGRLARLRLDADGRAEADPEYQVRATGILKRYYGELLLALAGRWAVRAFWFDWRKDLRLAAASLEEHIAGWFRADEPVHIVAHSMGGLVARTFMKLYPERWGSMRGADGQGGRLVMLGTPNHGSFTIPQVIAGIEGMVRKLALLDLSHSLADVLRITNTFPGSCQMLPSPFAVKGVEPLYRAETWRGAVAQAHLDAALKHHQDLSTVVDPNRMIYVAGYNQPTLARLTDLARVDAPDAYEETMAGDGRVPHELGRLALPDGRTVPTYYVEESHGDLPVNDSVLGALDELLMHGATTRLPAALPVGELRTVTRGAIDSVRRRQQEDEARLEAFVRRIEARRRSGIAVPVDVVTSEARSVEDIVTRGWLPVSEGRPASRPVVPIEATTIEIGLRYGTIETIHDQAHDLPVDAIAVGHYQGVRPQNAELALDRAISSALRPTATGALGESDLLLTQYTDRGTISGVLGQPFFLLDPRPGAEAGPSARARLIAVAGMGAPGRFGVPELTVLARELCWAVGRVERRHLATVLIGAGAGNLAVEDAVNAWVRGIKHAVSGCTGDDPRRLRRVTFVENDPRRLRAVRNAILAEERRLAAQNRLVITYTGLDEHEIEAVREHGLELERREFEARWRAAGTPDAPPTRITVSLKGTTYRFGAITASASIPEREIALDPRLVNQANDELAAEADVSMQVERGRLLEGLLVPADLRPVLFTEAPLVMLLDRTTAWIHWEMMAQPAPAARQVDEGLATSLTDDDSALSFLAISRGFTRQLRTTFAPLPEPPPPPQRVLRVLVVADPAADNRLAGAEAEGVEVADLFESFNTLYAAQTPNRIEVVRLIGPAEATRTNVLRELMLRWYDVLHFAGHCLYDKKDPPSSGWIFTGGDRLAANELRRIDRIPKFVLSNACESGVTPQDPGQRSVELAPSFAEAFFERGVSNFVCTAWPVEDAAARDFALRLYAGLLGLPLPGDGGQGLPQPKPMHLAMRDARVALAKTGRGARTWGAYQHYGNPHFRFFEPARSV